MKTHRKLLLSFLGSSLLLGGLGFASFRINSGIKQNTNYVIQNSLSEVKAAKDMTQSLQSIQASSEEVLLEIDREVLNNNDSHNREKIIRNQRIIQEQLSRFEKALLLTKKTTAFYMQFPEKSKKQTESLTKQKEEIEEFEWLERIEKNFFSYQNMLENYLIISQIDREKAYEFLEEKLEPHVREHLMPLVMQYQNDALEEMEEKAEEINKSILNDDLLMISFSLISMLISLGLGLSVSRSIEKSTVSKSYIDNILASMTDSLIVISFDGTIQKVNQSSLKLLKYEEAQLVNQNIKLILPDESLKIDPSVPQGFLGNYETTYLTKEGKKIPVAFSSSFILDESGNPKGIVCLARDITEKYLAEKALQESEERYALAARAANDGLWDWNLITNEVYFSLRWKSMLGYEDEEIENSLDEWFKLVHPDYVEQLREQIDDHLKSNISQFEISYPMLAKDGTSRWMLCNGIKVRNSEGKVYRIAGSQTDITQSRLMEEKLRYEALHDQLTGLPNRSFFLEELDKLFKLVSEGKDFLFAVLFIDLDGFKQINDTLGHLVGDRLLINFAHKIQPCLSSGDTFARLGGDEFAIVVKDLKHINNATSIAERIQNILKKPFQLQGQDVFVTASIGIAQSTSNYTSIEELLRDADAAMYEAKTSGKARYTIFESNIPNS